MPCTLPETRARQASGPTGRRCGWRDYSDDKIYAYDGPGMAGPTPPEPTNSPPAVSKVTPCFGTGVPCTWGKQPDL